MGTRGLGAIGGLFLGSVAQHVVSVREAREKRERRECSGTPT